MALDAAALAKLQGLLNEDEAEAETVPEGEQQEIVAVQGDEDVHGLGSEPIGDSVPNYVLDTAETSSSGGDKTPTLLEVLFEFADPELAAQVGGIAQCPDDLPIAQLGIGTLDFLAVLTRFENETGSCVTPSLIQADTTVGMLRASGGQATE